MTKGMVEVYLVSTRPVLHPRRQKCCPAFIWLQGGQQEHIGMSKDGRGKVGADDLDQVVRPAK